MTKESLICDCKKKSINSKTGSVYLDCLCKSHRKKDRTFRQVIIQAKEGVEE